MSAHIYRLRSSCPVPFRSSTSKHLAELFGVLSNPNRIRLIEELNRRGEMDVGSLEAELGISHSAVSQHLSLLRAHRIVNERRDGRHVSLQAVAGWSWPGWVLHGLAFMEREFQSDPMRQDLEQARAYWAAPAKPAKAKAARPR